MGLAADPELPSRLPDPIRFDAARAAVLAAAGKGVTPPAATDRPQFRGYALVWMQAELTARQTALKRKQTSAATVNATVNGWLTDPALATVRHPLLLAALPAEEAEQWLDFWAEVRRLRDATARPTAPRVPDRP
jgi:hypothetical protein